MPRATIRLFAVAVALVLSIPLNSRSQTVDPDIAKLVEQLSDPDHYVRSDAASFLAIRAAAAEGARRADLIPAIEPLVAALRDPRDRVRSTAAVALGNIRQRPETTVPALAALLRDPGKNVRLEAANSIGVFGSAGRIAVPSLLEALGSPDSDTCRAAARALGEIRSDAEVVVPALLEKMAAPPGRENCGADSALAKFGPEARAAVPALIELLNGSDADRKREAAYALAGIGPDAASAAPALVAALDSERTRFAAARALAKIGKNRDQALRALRYELVSTHPSTREQAAWAMIDLGAEGEAGIPDLVRALRDGDADVAKAAALALEEIAQVLREEGRLSALPALRSARTALQDHPIARVRSHAAALSSDVEVLEEMRRSSIVARVQDLFEAHPQTSLIALFYAAAALLWASLYWFLPTAIWRTNQALMKLPKVRLPGWLGGAEISLANLLLVGLLRHRERMLDSWVAENAEIVRAAMDELLMARGIGPALADGPALLNGVRVPQLRPNDLRPTFQRPIACVLVRAGDSAMADGITWRIARWAVHPNADLRLRENVMIPVFLEGSFVSPGYTGGDGVLLAIREQLHILDIDLPSLDFITALLRRQRLLAIVLGLAEANQETRAAVRPASPEFPAKALVVTSRTDYSLGNVRHTIIEPADSADSTLSAPSIETAVPMKPQTTRGMLSDPSGSIA